jgi:exonuclease SbcC
MFLDMITKIKLSNWRSHLNTELTFSRGVNALIGIMGSGKSSITEAISFGLFGTSPILNSRKITIEEMLTNKPQQSKGMVEIEFVINGKRYTVRRSIEKGKITEAELRENGNLLEVGSTAVTREIERIFGLDYDLFSKAIYSEQNGLDHFLRMPKGSRIEHIDRMLKLDKFERAREGAVNLANKVRQKREQMIKWISQLEAENLEQKIENIEKEIEILSKQKEKILNEKVGISKFVAELKQKVSLFEQKEKDLHKLEKDKERYRAALAEMRTMYDFEKIDKEDIEKKIKNFEKEIADLENKAKIVDEQIEIDRSKIAELNNRARNLEEAISNINNLTAICPVCESPINSEKKEDLLKKRIKEQIDIKKEIEKITIRLKDNKTRQNELLKILKEKNFEKSDLVHELDRLEELKKIAQRAKDYEQKLVIIENEISKLENEIEKIDIKNLRTELDEFIGKEKELTARLIGIDERIVDKRKNLFDLNKRLDILQSYKTELAADEQIIKNLSEFTKVLKLTQTQLRDEFVKTVNWIMDQIWTELYPYTDFESVRLIYDDDYILQLKERDRGWVYVDGIASGGERSMACLALRIAFAHTFSPVFKWLILDEPTHNLDSQAITQLTEILRDRIDQFAEQVFLITHEEKLSEGLTGMIYRLERDKSRGGPTKVVGG